MKLMTLENYAKVVQLIKYKGYDKKNAERLAVDIFLIVEKHGNTAEFYIEHLPDHNN